MMYTLTITGASDDLIEIGGDWEEELNHYWRDGEKLYIAVSDGTSFDVDYDEHGLWRFKRQFSGSARYSKVEGSAEEDTNDVVTLADDEPFKWVVCGDQRATK